MKSRATSTGGEHAFNLLAVNTVCFVLPVRFFHDAEVAARPVSHAEYSGFDMEAESDTSDVFGTSQSGNAVAQKAGSK